MANYNWPVTPSSSGPVQFILDGNPTQVSEDTGTPANSIPLPVKIIDGSGILVDFATAANQVTQITEAQTANTSLATIEAIDFATETTLASVLADTTTIAAVDFATETTLASIDTKTPALGAALSAASVPVVLSSDGPVPLPTGAATEATLLDVLADTTAIAAVDFATETTLASVLSDTNTLAAVDFATETTLASVLADTTSLDSKFGTLGQKTMAGSAPVVISSDQSPIPITGSISVGLSAWVFSASHDLLAVPVTSGAYVQIIASTSANTSAVQIYNSSGVPLIFAVGAAASEVDKFTIMPGGTDGGGIGITITSGSRVSVKAIGDDADQGLLLFNFLS